MSGKFITLEGIDGSGKTTQGIFLKNKLEELGKDVLFTREPGGVKGAEEIRNLLVQGEKDRWSNITEILLFFASRRHHLEKVLLPAINKGKVVICDRFTDSTIIYQGRENIHLKKMIIELNKSVIGIVPDLTLIIDIDPTKSLNRGLSRKSDEMRFEKFGLEFQTTARNGYISLAKTEKRYQLIDGNNSKDKVHQMIWNKVSKFLSLKL
ncbi:MAG: thymidylate kinase [Rhodobacterales bacterium]|nr:MAG: thymidylate kinase [Rhodobacterales bacterium]